MNNSTATNAMVTSSHHLASRTGRQILLSGGNAVEAAIAMAAELAVVYPQMNTIGGDNFWLIWNEKKGELRALNASGRAGKNACIEFYKEKGLTKIPPRGYLAANTVPGAVSGWQTAYEYSKSHLSGKFAFGELLAPAIASAEKGFLITHSLELWLEKNLRKTDRELRFLQRFAGFAQVFLKSDGSAYRCGERLKQPDLAGTLKLIAGAGAGAFYKGEIADRIVTDMQKEGGLLTAFDFEQHESNWVTPLSVSYRGFESFNLPPNTQGFASLAILNILNNFDMKSLGEGTADYYHVIVEATRLAFADRDQYWCDPDFKHIPLDYLLCRQHAQEQAGLINMLHAAADINPLAPAGDTVWFAVVDPAGNAVSMIQSIFFDFGSAVIPAHTGILLQNRGSMFSLDPDHINSLAPGKRPAHTLNPAMLFKDGKPCLLYGTMGGEGQPQTQAAIVTRIVDFGMTPQAAVAAPRWLYGRTWGEPSNNLAMEGRIPREVINELNRRGQPVTVVEDYSDLMGHAGAILIDRSRGIMFGAADPRSDGLATGF